MAELRVERKGRRIWPWLVLLVVLAAAVWAALEIFGPDDGSGTVVVEQAT